MEDTLNISSKSEDWRARLLSNFAATPFTLFGKQFASVEGFWQDLKFPEPEGSPEQEHVFKMMGYQVKKAGKKAPKRSTFTWRGKVYRVGSPEHQKLMYQALWAKFTQDRKAREALLATKGMVLAHVMPRDSVTIPGAIFAGMLMDIREKLIE